jgi:hypothetical protein
MHPLHIPDEFTLEVPGFDSEPHVCKTFNMQKYGSTETAPSWALSQNRKVLHLLHPPPHLHYLFQELVYSACKAKPNGVSTASSAPMSLVT